MEHTQRTPVVGDPTLQLQEGHWHQVRHHQHYPAPLLRWACRLKPTPLALKALDLSREQTLKAETALLAHIDCLLGTLCISLEPAQPGPDCSRLLYSPRLPKASSPDSTQPAKHHRIVVISIANSSALEKNRRLETHNLCHHNDECDLLTTRTSARVI